MSGNVGQPVGNASDMPDNVSDMLVNVAQGADTWPVVNT
jgi:hypothetical protein